MLYTYDFQIGCETFTGICEAENLSHAEDTIKGAYEDILAMLEDSTNQELTIYRLRLPSGQIYQFSGDASYI